MARCRLDGTARGSGSGDDGAIVGGDGDGSSSGRDDTLIPGLSQFVRSMSKQASGASKLFSGQELANTLWGLAKVNQAIGMGDDSAPFQSQTPVRPTPTAPPIVPLARGKDEEGAGGDREQSRRHGDAAGSLPSSASSPPSSRSLRQDSLLLPLVDAARGRAGSMAPSSLAQIAWAGSRMEGAQSSGSGSLLASAVVSAALPRMHEFGAQELTTLVHSLARQKDEVGWALFRAAGDAAVPLLRSGDFTPAGMANLVWAFGRKGQMHDEMAEAVSSAALPRLHQFPPQELANLMWGLVQLGRRDRALLDRAALLLVSGRATWSQLTPPNPAASASAAGAPISPAGPVGGQGRAVGTASAVIAWCFARCGYYSPGLYDSLAEAAAAHIDAIAPYNLAQLLWAMSAHDHRHARLLVAAGDAVALRLTINPRPWSGPTPADAATKRRRRGGRGGGHVVPSDGEPIDGASGSGRNQAEMEPMHPTDVSVVAWVYAKLGCHHAPLFDAILRSAMLHPQLYDLRGWSRLAWSFSTLCLPQEAFFVGRLQLQSPLQRRKPSPVVVLGSEEASLVSGGADEGSGEGAAGWERRRSSDSALEEPPWTRRPAGGGGSSEWGQVARWRGRADVVNQQQHCSWG